MTEKEDKVNKPNHYVQGRKYEPIHVIRDWDLNFALGNAVKYISRAGRKVENEGPGSEIAAAIQDLKKAAFYVQDEIKALEAALVLADKPKDDLYPDEPPFPITINGKSSWWHRPKIFYHEIVSIVASLNPAIFPQRPTITVHYRDNKNNLDCSLSKDGHWAEVEAGMVINCILTDKA